MTTPRHGRALTPAAAAAQKTDDTAERPRTLPDHLRSEIADSIMRGEMAPGVALDEMALAQRFNVSRTPVREAIRLLAASGLVEARPHRSALVARPDRDTVKAMFEALRELEVLCATFAAARMPPAECAALAQLNRSLLTVARRDDATGYHEANEAFHRAIYAGAKSPYLEELTITTRARIAPFSRAQFGSKGRMLQSQREHEVIVAAIAQADEAAAQAAMRSHISIVHDSYVRQHPICGEGAARE